MKKLKQKLFGSGNKGGNPGGPRNLVLAVLFFVLCLALLTKLGDLTNGVTQIPYSKFIEQVEQGKIKAVRVYGTEIAGEFKDGARFATLIVETPANWELLKKQQVEINVEEPANGMSFWYIMFFVMLLTTVVPGLIWYFMQKSKNGAGGGAGGIFSMGKSRAKLFMPSTIKDNLNSVAGAQEAKEELYDVVDFLRHPAKYQRLGAKISRGVLLIGEPGNGKTLLARAVAGEANCPFFRISGSDFIEVFVGVGAARVRDLFAQARKVAPAIIFIDEIDAVGRHRGSGMGGGHDEREQTLNQILTEMDGFDQSGEPVIVIGATNRADVLDRALLRPGRFDRRVHVPYPDLTCREQILKVHTKNIKIDLDSVNLSKVARGTQGFSGADLANLVNEAAIHASKQNKKNITVEDFEEARDKIMLGKELKTIILSDEEKEITAYHEAGHALVALMIPDYCDPLHKVTIMPRGGALGVTHSLPEKERYLSSKEEMISKVKMALGGRAAEELVFGKMTSGASSDFATASHIVRNMVCKLGMSEAIGPVIYSQDHTDYTYSQKTAEKIDAEVQSILEQCYKDALKILADNRDKLNKLAESLLDKETLYSEEIYVLLEIQPRADFKLS